MSKVEESSFGALLGALLRAKRDEAGLSQQKLAGEVFGDESKKSQISKLENGKIAEPQSKTIRALMDALSISETEITELRVKSVQKSVPDNEAHKTISTRREFIVRACALLRQTQSYRAIITGPFFCHPDWYFTRKLKHLQYPDFDRAQRQFLQRINTRNHSVRIVFTNSPRYLEKVRHYVADNELRTLLKDSISNIKHLWGANYEKGPDLCCARLGSYHIPYIFDHNALIQYRTDQMTPTAGGIEYTSQGQVNLEKSRFDDIFTQKSKGQTAEIEKLRSFFESLLKQLEP